MAFKHKFVAFFLKNLAKGITKPKKEVVKILPTSVENPDSKTVSTRHGNIPVFIYKPNNSDGKPLGIYYNLHGGGYVMKHARQDDHMCKYLAEKLNCIVISPEYETAPHHPFPIPPDQCFDVYKWILENGNSLGGNTSKIAIGGQSAGAAMSIGICVRAKEEGLQVPQMLVANYPPLDLTIDPKSKKSTVKKPLITTGFEEMVQQLYLVTKENKSNPLASPALFSDLSALPKTILIAAAHDTLLKENQAFAKKLSEEGVPHVYREISNADHFYTHAGPAIAAKECMDLMVDELSTVLT